MVALNIPLVTWCVIAFAMVTLVVVRLFYKAYHESVRHGHLFEIGNEQEDLFVTGDRIPNRDNVRYDDED